LNSHYYAHHTSPIVAEEIGIAIVYDTGNHGDSNDREKEGILKTHQSIAQTFN